MQYSPVSKLSQQLGIIFSGSFAGFMVMLDNNIVNISLPYIARYFGIGTSVVVQISLVYFLVLSGSMILFGKLADQYGVRRIFVWGFAIFTASSLLCGLSPSFPILLAARAAQGIGGSMLFSTALSLITLYIPAGKRGWAFGIFSPINSLGVLVGSPLGGLITGLLSWHWIFLVNVPVGITAIIVALRHIPADPPRDTQKVRFDFAGTALSFVGLTVLVYILNQGRHLGYGSPLFLCALLFSLCALCGFGFWESRTKHPLLDLSIFKNRNFSLALLASLAAVGLMAGNGILMPFYMTYILRINIELAGFILMINPVIFSGLSMVIGPLSDKVSRTRLTSIGMSVALIGCIGFIIFGPTASLVVVVAYGVVQGIAYSFFITPNNNLVMSLAPGDQQSVSSSVFKLSTNLGQMFGILGMEMAFTFVLPSHVHATSQVLKSLPPDTVVRGFQYAYVAGAVLCLAALLLSLFVRDSVRRAPAEEPVLA